MVATVERVLKVETIDTAGNRSAATIRAGALSGTTTLARGSGTTRLDEVVQPIRRSVKG